ncbi:type IX secretion system PorP/SprF family membrane protein [Catalinimonas alkaloidigena]|uniref:PorP/SprF family type IX secretion system membrane protein n=1 Tax=Catalinimonas alkaloidigena TaxID=1075417 RepID=UPI00240774B1|nr:PorP/SprF family type IX secretion system membrane protein [Catalinimonas alkaloidigena]MDF9795521.1 type IX secretion system PorP/SprF family membrane protein [Catalinimonas alkaloidigena]
MRKTVIIFLFLLISICTSEAQRMPYFAHYYNNPYLYNPAYAGYDKHTVFYLTHRQQWYGVEGAPVSSQLSFHSPLGNANPIFIGADIVDDRIGALKHNAVKFSLAYMIPLSSEHEHYIKTAFSAGIGMHTYDLVGMDIGDDLVLQAALANQTFLDGRFGFKYHNRGFNLSVALPHLFTPPPMLIDGFSDINFDQFSRMIFSTHYRFNFNEEGTTAFEPTVLYHYSSLESSQLEALGIFYFNDSFWAGGGYQQQSGFSGTAGFKVKNLKFSYAYSTGGSKISAYGAGTHELQLGLVIGKKKEVLKRKPRLSTQNTIDDIPDEALLEKHAKSQEKSQRKRKKKKKEEVPDRKKVNPTSGITIIENEPSVNDTPEVSENADHNDHIIIEEHSRANETEQKELTPSVADEASTPAREKPQQESNYEDLRFDSFENTSENKGVIQLGKHTNTSAPAKNTARPEAIESKPALSTPAQTQEQEEVEEKQEIAWNNSPFEEAQAAEDAHSLAMKGGFYIIAGTFSTQDNAEKMVGQLTQQGFFPEIGYHSEKKYFYVHVYQSSDKDQVIKELERLKQNASFQQSWILTVAP